MKSKSKLKQKINNNKKPLYLLFLFCFIALVFCFVNFSGNRSARVACAHSSSDGVTIHLDEDGFDPKQLTIETGTKVIFENSGFDDVWPASDDHPTHENYSDLDPRRPLLSGESWEFTFNEPGTYGLHDHITPISLAEIVVSGNAIDASTKTADDCSSDRNSAASNSQLKEQIDKDFIPPTNPGVLVEDVLSIVKSSCPKVDHSCVERQLGAIVDESGGEAALMTYKQLIDTGYIDFEYGDGHQFAHRIGRRLATTYGVSVKAFELCSDIYNFGCQHGYFEWVLGRTANSTEALTSICESIDEKYEISKSSKANCYHGGGHGIMMSLANDVNASIIECDTLPKQEDQKNCYQGVFMENVQAEYRGEARAGVFDKSQPLEPCASLDSKYQYECYLYHGSWLLYNGFGNFKDAANECMKVQTPNLSDGCLRGVAINIANSGREDLLSSPASGEVGEDSWAACQEFAEWKYELCVRWVVEGFSNLDGPNTDNRSRFCRSIDFELIDRCNQSVIESLRQ